MAPTPLAVAAAGRPYPGEVVNGDAWQVDWFAGGCRIAVIDGLGHGPEAAEAAQAAQRVLADAPDLSPERSLQICHEALRHTRGAAISIARIDLAGHRLTYAGVGNVEARLRQGVSEQRLITQRGIVGSGLFRARAFEVELQPEWCLILHSDGVSARFQTEALNSAGCPNPQTLADQILNDWGRETDDATVVVACARLPDGASANIA